MVLPIIIGVGVTVAALTVKSALKAYSRYAKLQPSQIAMLNNITIKKPKNEHDRIMQETFWQYRGGFNNHMNEGEALLILEIEGDDILNLTHESLKKRHRRMMMLNHPDKGGSPFLALQINKAKDVLEKSYMFRK